MCRTLIGRVLQVQEEMAQVEFAGGVMTLNAMAYPEVRVGDYVLAQARLLLGIITEDEAQQMLAAEHELLHLFDTLAQEDEDDHG